MKRTVLGILSAALLVPAVLGAASPAQAAPFPPARPAGPKLSDSVLGTPSNFHGQRQSNGSVRLTWDTNPRFSYFELRAVSHTAGTPLYVDGGANIAGSQSSFTVSATSNTAVTVGGTDYYLKGCSEPHVCGGEATAFVPFP